MACLSYYIKLMCTMDSIQQAFLIILILNVINAQSEDGCGKIYSRQITSLEGEITEKDLDRGTEFSHRWTFTGLPNNNAMLVLNMTRLPYDVASIQLNDEFFVDESIYCKILKFSDFNATEALEINLAYPECKARFGKRTDTSITYCKFQDSFSLPPRFTIQYKVIDTTKDTHVEKRSSNTLTITLTILGALLASLILILIVILVIRQRRLKVAVTSSEDNRQLNDDLYQTIQESPSQSAERNYSVIQNGGNNNHVRPGHRESVKNVINPLYDQELRTHSYEYIDLRKPPATPQDNNDPYEVV